MRNICLSIMLVLLNVSTCYAFSYDENGNLLTDNSGHIYQYNAKNELVSFSNAQTNKQLTTHYHYNPNGLLDAVINPHTTESFIYDYQRHKINLLSSMDSIGIISFIDNSLLCVSINNHCFYRAYEQKNTTNLWLNNNSMLEIEGFSVYGKHLVFKPSAPSNPLFKQLGYDGQYEDNNSGLIYLHARFYNPRLMRFMQRDSYHLLNRYAFADGDPVNKADPTGHFSWVSGLSVAAIGIGILAPALGSPLLYGLGALSNVLATSMPLWHGNMSRIIGNGIALFGSLSSTMALMSGNAKAIFAAELGEHLLQGIAMPIISSSKNQISFKKAGISAIASLPFAIYMASSASLITNSAEEGVELNFFSRFLYQDVLLESHERGQNNASSYDYLRSFAFGAVRMGASEGVRLSYFPISSALGDTEEYPNSSIWQNMGMAALSGGFQYSGMAATHIRMPASSKQWRDIDLQHLFYNAFNYGWGEQFTVAQLEMA